MKYTLREKKQNAGFKGVNKVQSYPGCYVELPVFKGKHGYKTGLTEEEAKELCKQKFGSLKNEDFLMPESDFWKDFKIKFDAKGVPLDDEIVDDKIQILVAQNHKKIDFDGNNPRAPYELINEDIKKKNKIDANKYEKEAFKRLVRLSPSQIRATLAYYTGYYQDSSVDIDTVEAALTGYMKSNFKGFVNLIDNPKFEEKLLIANGVAFNIITKENKYAGIQETTLFMNGTKLGVGVDAAADALTKKTQKAQDLYSKLVAEVDKYIKD